MVGHVLRRWLIRRFFRTWAFPLIGDHNEDSDSDRGFCGALFVGLQSPNSIRAARSRWGQRPPAGLVAALVQAAARVDLAVCLERLEIPVGMAVMAGDAGTPGTVHMPDQGMVMATMAIPTAASHLDMDGIRARTITVAIRPRHRHVGVSDNPGPNGEIARRV